MRHRALSGMVLALACLMLLGGGVGGCGLRRTTVEVDGPALGPEYATQVNVDNWRGSVHVVADPRASAPEVRYRNVKAGKMAPRARDLPGMTTAFATTSFEGGHPVLRVVSRPAATGEAPDVATQLEVVVPRIHGVSIRNRGGPVEVQGFEGPVSIENGTTPTDGGDVAAWTGAAISDPVNITTTRGRVVYQVGPGSTGRFDLSTDKGNAEFVSLLGQIDQVLPEEGRYRGVLNKGSNPIMLHSGLGHVVARVMENAATYGPELWAGELYWPAYPGWLAKMGETLHLRDPDAPH
ncbi:MAG: hypothetical protein WD749_06495 [Phycisphaerales bacterium]